MFLGSLGKGHKGAISLQRLMSSPFTPSWAWPSKISFSSRVNSCHFSIQIWSPQAVKQHSCLPSGGEGGRGRGGNVRQGELCPPNRMQENSWIAVYFPVLWQGKTLKEQQHRSWELQVDLEDNWTSDLACYSSFSAWIWHLDTFMNLSGRTIDNTSSLGAWKWL